MTDIIKRLKAKPPKGFVTSPLMIEAADEIERLREALQLIADPLRGQDVTHYLVVASYQSIARKALEGK